MTSRIRIVAIALTSVLAVSGCSATQLNRPGSTPQFGGNLVIGSLPTVLDPAASTSRANWMIAASVCEGLFANDAQSGVRDGLVESWDYDEDDLTYSLTLRDGITFHDGSELSAEDVVASLTRFRQTSSGTQFDALTDEVSAQGRLEVSITLTEPSGGVPALLATPDTSAYIMSEESIAAYQPDESMDDLVCTGPYQLDEYSADERAVASRFDDYVSRSDSSDGSAGAKVAYADTLTFRPYNPSSAINQLITGEVNVVSNLSSLDQIGVFDENDSLNATIQMDGGFNLLQFNLLEGPFTDLKLRQALLNAIDPQQIALQELGDTEYYSDSSSLFTAGSDWYSDAGREIWVDRDPERAAALLRDAGYDDTPIRILYRPDQDNYGPVLRQQLEAAGFAVELNAVDPTTFTATRTDPGAWDLFLAGGNSYSDPLTAVFLNDDFPGWWTTPEKKNLMTQITEGATLDERKPLWDDLQNLIWTELPFVTLGHKPSVGLTSVNVGGYEPSKGTVRGFYNVWIEQ